jgi:hypothetical protein
MTGRGPRTDRPARAAALVLAAVAALTVAGCQYLYGFAPYDPTLDPEDYAFPSPIAIYPSGRATVAIDGGTALVLDRVTSPGRLDETFGSDVVMTNGDGWYVRVSGAMPPGTIYSSAGYVTIDRVFDGSHWTTADPSRCIVTLEQADATGLRGAASCKGLRWSDTLGAITTSFEPAYVAGQAPFDAEITFEATTGPNAS